MAQSSKFTRYIPLCHVLTSTVNGAYHHLFFQDPSAGTGQALTELQVQYRSGNKIRSP